MTTDIHGRWVWYELMTPDADGARAFYESVFAWSITPGTEPPIFYGHIALTDGADGKAEIGGVLPLTDAMIGHGYGPRWIGYIAVDAVDAALESIVAAGGKVLMPKMTLEGTGDFATVTDMGGAAFYIMAPTMAPGAQPSRAFSPDGVGSCGWNELYAADDAAALAFYADQFGWREAGQMDMGPMGAYRFLESGQGRIGAMMKAPPFVPSPTWNFYFRVADFGTAVAAVTAGGGTITHGPMPVPTGDWIIHARDPQGAAFALVGQKKE